MDLESKVFSVPFHWDSAAVAITILVLVFLIGIGFFLYSFKWPTVLLWLKYLLIIVFLATIIIGVGFMPIRLTANEKTISIKRVFGPLEIPRSEIIESRQLMKSDITHSIRTFGSGGLFGYFGQFKSDRIGDYTMYATELTNFVLIRTYNKQYVFSCAHPQEFIVFLQN
ncbi:MAG: PH domain-containing protein [Bacteroidales bacterium]|nr:PH domain-containing protein [Bacteroidales bacterium]